MRFAPIFSLAFSITMYFAIISMIDARATHFCTPCVTYEECQKEPDRFCPFGEVRDFCRRRVCAKGPGDRCGGPKGIFGSCSSGMWCKRPNDASIGTCEGCASYNLNCLEDELNPY